MFKNRNTTVGVVVFIVAFVLAALGVFSKDPADLASNSQLQKIPDEYDIYITDGDDTYSHMALRFYGDAHYFTWLAEANGKEYCLGPALSPELVSYKEQYENSCHYVTARECVKIPRQFIGKRLREELLEECEGGCLQPLLGWVIANREESRLYIFNNEEEAHDPPDCCGF